jgi:hypothetical protein
MACPPVSRTVWATSLFLDDLAAFADKYERVYDILEEFIDHRKTAGYADTFGKEDSRLTDILAGTWHIHIIHGRVIVLYTLTQHSLSLYRVISHAHLSERSKKSALARYIGNLTDSDFRTFQVVPSAEASVLALTENQVGLVRSMIWECASHPQERPYIRAALAGSRGDLIAYLIIMAELENHAHEPEKLWGAMERAFGGNAGLLEIMRTALAAFDPSRDGA